ncbi:MAG: acetylxylan esterase [Blastocatellia bacterium]
MRTWAHSIPVLSAVLLLCAIGGRAGAQTTEGLDFMTGLAEFHAIKSQLPAHVNQLAAALIAERERQVSSLDAPQDVAARKARLRERMVRALGGFPARTPLNARVVGSLERAEYRIEKIIFESQPGFYVTANLYLPKQGRAPYPGILFPLGHEPGGKAYPVWQQMLGALAKKGYVALTWDPLGQGERVQLYDSDWGESKVRESTTEHTLAGIQCLLLGDNLARHTIWDGMRAIDYLVSRPEVDPARIGCTGNSGGGTMTAYLSTLDDRIQVAAPSCYITSWRRLLETIGPQDAEQVLLPWLRDGLEHADFVHAFAPRPYLMLSAIRDFFAISGARETYAEAKRGYAALGAPERLSMVEADDEHGYTKPRRLAAYRWFGRWLKGAEDQGPEPEVEIATADELQCTGTGQVVTSIGGETIFSLNQQRMAQLGRKEPALTDLASYQEEIRRRVRQTSRIDAPTGAVSARAYGEIARSGYRIQKLVYESEPGIAAPALLFLPDPPEARRPAILYVHGRGKSAEAGPGQEIEQLIKAGFVVLAIDLRGVGETQLQANKQGTEFYRYFGDYDTAMTALLIDRPLVGMRALDVRRAIDLLAARAEVDGARIYGFGKEAGAVPLLYAAVFDDRIKKIALEEMLVSYQTVINSRIHRHVFEHVVPGALKAYDLPALVAALAPRPTWVVNAVDALGHQIRTSEAIQQYKESRAVFRMATAEPSLRIIERRGHDRLAETYRHLLDRE